MNISMVPTPVKVGSVECEVPWPAILLSDWLKVIFQRTDGSVLLQYPAINADKWTQELASFWSRYQMVDPRHPVFRLPEKEIAYSIPLGIPRRRGQGAAETASSGDVDAAAPCKKRPQLHEQIFAHSGAFRKVFWGPVTAGAP